MPPKSKLHKWECPTGWLVRLCSQYAHYRFNIFSPFFVILILYIILPTWPNGCRVHFNYNVMELDHLAIDKFQISIPCVFELGHQLGPNELVWNTNQALVLVLICSPVTLFITQIAIALLPQHHIIHTKTLINWCLVNQILRKTDLRTPKHLTVFSFLCQNLLKVVSRSIIH